MPKRMTFGWLITAAWIAMWLLLLVFKWCDAKDMGFNEWGDFFAGVSAPLAFLWLVIGYFQQGEELGLNTTALGKQERALQLQVEELKHSVEQQSKSATALNEQSKISKTMARINAINHTLDSIERQISSARMSLSESGVSEQRALQVKRAKYEASLEKLLSELENVEEVNDTSK